MPKRRRGSRAARPLPGALPHALPAGTRPPSFEVLVERALATIPEPFRPALRQVAIVIEDEASDEQLDAGGVRPGGELYGLYEGVPRTAWGADLAAIPNKISLFRLPLEATAPTRSPVFSGILPARSAASAPAPAGSRTCFIRSAAKRMPARIVGSDR